MILLGAPGVSFFPLSMSVSFTVNIIIKTCILYHALAIQYIVVFKCEPLVSNDALNCNSLN